MDAATRLTIAIHLASPTRINPSLNSTLSGKKAHASPNMRSGAKIQLTASEKATWYQILRLENSLTRDVGDTLQRMGHIMTMRAMAGRQGEGELLGGNEEFRARQARTPGRVRECTRQLYQR